MIYTHCPRCGSDFKTENFATSSAVCECGWCDSTATRSADDRLEMKKIKIMAGTAIGMLVLFGHFVSWGSYATQIPFVKAAQVAGLLSERGHVELAEACIGLNKWSCAKDAYVGAYKEAGNTAHIASLASLQARLTETKAAIATYAHYVQAGGNDAMALLKYGVLLEQDGQEAQAFAIYEKSIAADTEILPVQATTAIVRLMMKEGRYQEAYKRITEFHESAGNAKGYLNTELSQLETFLGSGKKAKKRASMEHATPKTFARR